jgi:hypothetical protein
MVTLKEFRSATEHARMLQSARPIAVEARYNPQSDQVLIRFNNGGEFRFPAHTAQGLENASARELRDIEISPSGFGIYFPQLDVDLDVPELVLGHYGSKKWMASNLGTLGGRATSEAKKHAARANGALGGRPKHKKVAAGR